MRTSRWPKADARWYLGVKCRKCEEPILFALDHSEGNTQPAAAGKLLLTCPRTECGHRDDYSAARVSRFQKPPGADGKAVR